MEASGASTPDIAVLLLVTFFPITFGLSADQERRKPQNTKFGPAMFHVLVLLDCIIKATRS